MRPGVRRVFRLPAWRKANRERDVDEEIALHLALREEQLAREGLAPDAARREASRRFGALADSRRRLLEAAGRRQRRQRRTEFLADVKQDVGYALRTLRRQKGWTAVTVATLALGIGATVAVFSAVSTLMLHPLPYPHADRMVFVYQEPSTGNNTGISVTLTPQAPVVRAWLRDAHSFEALEGYTQSPVRLRTEGEPVTSEAGSIFPSFPRFAGQRPLIGRMFSAGDIAQHARVVLLGEGFWRSRYGSRSTVLGSAVVLNDSTYTIIGVLPAALRAPLTDRSAPDFWLPLDVHDDARGMMLLGRLRPGVTHTAAQAELDSIAARSEGVGAGELRFHTRIVNPADRLRFRDSLILLSAAVGLVLLIACVNVAHLLLARTASRRPELALRVALGARRGRIFRQLLAESAVLTTAGAALGVALGWMGLRLLIALRPDSLEELALAHVDRTTLALAAGITVLCGLVFGVMGAVQAAGRPAAGVLRTASTRGVSGRGGERARALLVVTEMALSAALIVGATMLVRSVTNLQRADPGFRPAGLYAVPLTLPGSRYPGPEARVAALARITEQASRVTGVQALTVAATPPGSMSFSIGRLEIGGEPPPSASTTSFVEVNAVRQNYFRVMGIRLVQGSVFTDTAVAAGQVIVNQGFARKHWGAASAIGRQLRIAQTGTEPWLTIVGVAADAATFGPAMETTEPLLYTPLGDTPAPAIIVRVTGAAALGQMRALVRGVDPDVPVTVESIADRIAGTLATPRFVMRLLAIFTILALVLAGVGLYGVMAYSVARRTHEIGIRMALGAPRRLVACAVMLRGAALALAGAVVGIVAAHWGTRLIEHQLFGVARTDPLSFAVSVAVLAGAAALACVVPTLRALRVDPILAIREGLTP